MNISHSYEERGSIFSGLLIVVLLLILAVAMGERSGWFGSREVIYECPEKWLEERPPTAFEDRRTPKQYFIHKGERYEFEDFDAEWVKKNCGLWPELETR